MGCENGLVGKWETDNFPGCSGGGEFTIEDNELKGDGELVLPVNGTCATCPFDVEATDNGDDEYELEISFDNCSINGSAKFDLDCTRDDNQLDCESNAVADIAPYDDWEKQD
jgi:hypothetical protein